MDSELLKTVWDVAQLAGAGGSVVLMIVAHALWKQHKEDTEYIRDADKNTLTVLNSLTATLGANNQNHEAIKAEIKQGVDAILHQLRGVK